LIEAASDYYEREFDVRLLTQSVSPWPEKERLPSTVALLARAQKEFPRQANAANHDLTVVFTAENVSRYFVAGEQTYLAVLDNLDSIASRLQSVSAIDERHATARIAAIGRQKRIAPADEEEIEALKARLALREAQLDRVNTLLTFNENAITEFDRVNNAVAEVKGTRAQASVDLETAIAELEALAARARKLAA